ncbi:ParB/RepB/Spo0J family partition protein [Novosphingobium terrae]|uniref:ParB/RepB/Spo0J family partition protein n=1 Tax=Novosphingobium terrae TaxID=2726189 RepID=UPI0019823288|nr:ParB/RepB/Spo0J family partition protein [Novosphingobium terrae]
MTLTTKLSLLRLAPSNVRKVAPSPAGIEQLASDIAAHGIVQSLAVYKEGRHFHVFAGGRRLRALNFLKEAKTISGDFDVPVIVRTKAEAVELSIVENAQRESMHPADSIRAFKTLRDESGMGAEDIAARFGYSVGHVRKLLCLGSLAPALIDAMGEDRLGIEAARALTLTDDQALQAKLFETFGDSAYRIRSALTAEKMAVWSGVFRFVGPEAYEQAGGTITADLFNKVEEGYADDAALVHDLALEKLEVHRQELIEQGWKTVEVCVSRPDNLYCRPSLLPISRDPNDAEALEIKGIKDAIVEAENGEPDEGTICDLYEDLRVAEDRLKGYPAELRSQNGVIAVIGNKGELEVHYLRLQKEETHARPAREKVAEGAYSKPLLEQLTAIRSIALQDAVANDPALALDILLDTLTGQYFHKTHSFDFPAQINIERHAPKIDDSLIAGGGINHVHALLADRFGDIPAEGRFAAIRGMDQAMKMHLLAGLVGASLNATITNAHINTQKVNSADAYAEAAALNLSQCWAPNVELFSRMKKPDLLAILKEHCGHDAAENCAKLKRSELAQEVSERIPHGWLPAPMTIGGLLGEKASNPDEASDCLDQELEAA